MWGEKVTKKMQKQHWQVEDALLGHPNTNLYVSEALLSANRTTAFPYMGVQIALPKYYRKDSSIVK